MRPADRRLADAPLTRWLRAATILLFVTTVTTVAAAATSVTPAPSTGGAGAGAGVPARVPTPEPEGGGEGAYFIIDSGSVAPPTPAPARPSAPAAWLGISLASESESRDDRENDEGETRARGMRVEGVFEGSPADEAGIRASDRILSIEGRTLEAPADLFAVMRTLEPDSWATFTIQRGKSVLDVRVRLSSRPRDTSSLRLRRGWIGVRAIMLPPSLRAFFGAPEDSGVMVSEVVPGSPADSAGISIGDVIFAASEGRVASPGELERIVTMAGVDNKLEIRLMRYGADIVVEASVGHPPDDKDHER